MMSNNICPVCEEGALTEQVIETTIRPRDWDQDITVDMKFSVCDNCGSETSDKDQILFNRQQVLNQVGYYE